MNTRGVLEVHENVVCEANTAGQHGGAVSVPLEIAFHLAILVFSDSFLRPEFI